MTKKQTFGAAVFVGLIALLNIAGFSHRLANGDQGAYLVSLIAVGILAIIGAACLAYYARPSKWDRDK